MLFLSDKEKMQWKHLADELIATEAHPGRKHVSVRSNLQSVFHAYTGALLTTSGLQDLGREWFRHGAQLERDGFFFNTFLTSFLERQNKRLIMPAVAFEDPRPYVHFTKVPEIQAARRNFIQYSANSLPAFNRPVRVIDLGCGNGALVAELLAHWHKQGKIPAVEEIVLLDPSTGMLELAERTVKQAFPAVPLTPIHARIESWAPGIDSHYDIALSSLAFHHMPLDKKKTSLEKIAPWIDHFLLFEVDANNDTPELNSPDLMLSVYQSYARMIDFVFAHDAPIDVVYACVDCFLMTEVVSFLTQPRGQRTDYHMLRTQWHNLFQQVMGREFTWASNTSCYDDEYFSMYMLHMARRGVA